MEPPVAPRPQGQGKQPVAFPKLEKLDPSEPHSFFQPVKRINDGPDVARFLTSKAYRDIGIFLLQLNRALCPRRIPSPATGAEAADASSRDPSSAGGAGRPAKLGSALAAPRAPAVRARTFPLDAARQDPPSVQQLQALLARLDAMVEEAPPDPGPRRFGNASFRKWHALLGERVDGLLKEYLSPQVMEFGQAQRTEGADQAASAGGPIVELRAYFLGAFGSSQRLDYGTGHELSFLAFLGCLWKLRAFEDGPEEGDIERSIVLGVIEPYLKVIRRLILTYTLEPAGSHGVWGLDDHSFIPYIFGSAQLTRPISEDEPMPTEGSVAGAPRPSDVVKSTVVDLNRGRNMYFSAIGFINDVKKGPFWEHSPILFDISGIKDGWGKINKGMIKMYNAEVLSKFPVVQHFPFGSLFSWDADPEAAPPVQSVHMANQPMAAAATSSWGHATAMPGNNPGSGGGGIPYSRAPWAAGAGGNAPAGPPARGGKPDTGPPPPSSFPAGQSGTTSAQFSVTKAPWAK